MLRPETDKMCQFLGPKTDPQCQLLGPEMMVTHFNDFWGQKVIECISFWAQKSLKLKKQPNICRKTFFHSVVIIAPPHDFEGPASPHD
jgi:hypothetical protein